MSHTVSIDIEIRDRAAWLAAAEAAGAEIIGDGEHKLYESRETGFAIKLPGWRFPVVLTDKGLRFDNYEGQWGDQAQLDKLLASYAIGAARAKADALGWYSEVQPDGSLLIYHPDGGTLTVTGDGVSVDCVEGQSCIDLSAPIEEAMGKATERALTDDFYVERARVTASEGSEPATDTAPPPADGSEPTS